MPAHSAELPISASAATPVVTRLKENPLSRALGGGHAARPDPKLLETGILAVGGA
jgi:hypothetical protein